MKKKNAILFVRVCYILIALLLILLVAGSVLDVKVKQLANVERSLTNKTLPFIPHLIVLNFSSQSGDTFVKLFVAIWIFSVLRIVRVTLVKTEQESFFEMSLLYMLLELIMLAGSIFVVMFYLTSAPLLSSEILFKSSTTKTPIISSAINVAIWLGLFLILFYPMLMWAKRLPQSHKPHPKVKP